MSIAQTPVSTRRPRPRRGLLRAWLSVPLQTRLIVLVLTINIVILAAVVGLNGYRGRSIIANLQNQLLQNNNNAIAADVTTWLTLQTNAVIELSKLPDIASMEPARQTVVLKAMASSYPELILIHTLDLNGNDIARNDTAALSNYADRYWFQQARLGTQLSYEVSINQTTGKPAFNMATPIRDNYGNIIGIAGITAELSKISNVVLSATLGKGGYAYIVDINNRVVAHTDPTYTENELRDLSTYPPVAMLRQGARGQIAFTDANQQKWQAYVNVFSNGWGVVVQESETTLMQPLATLQELAIILILAGSAFMFIAAWFTIRRTLEPIGVLTETATAVASGDLSREVEIISRDEVGALARAFNTMTAQLKNTIGTLEQRVSERTRDLERRSAEIQTAAQIARDASMAQNVEELLVRSARYIHERFAFYHVGIFLMDEGGEYAVLRAAGGEAGKLMLANKHKLKSGEVGIVGHVARTGEARIALDVGSDAFHFQNPLLPYTRSELTLPLKAGNRIIGVLDIQSDKVNAFDQNDISILQVLVDQISVAIERTRLVQELRQNTVALEQALQQSTARTWQVFVQQTQKKPGYRYDGIVVEPLAVPSPDIQEALDKNKTISKKESGKSGSTLAVPIRLRGQTLGVLNLHFQTSEIPAETTRLVEEATGRLALALENARLVQDARRLATRERQIGSISAQIQQSTNIETVLQNTVRELGNTLGVPRTFIQIGLKPSGEDGSDNEPATGS